MRALGSLLLPALALLAACGDEAPARRVSGVLITLDTTNPGALDCYGRDRGLTPALARLAEESLVFDRARSVAPITMPAHASMHTGLYPPRHTVRDNGYLPLPAAAETLAERARDAGLRTAAFLAAAVLAPTYGLDQGFEVFDCPSGSGYAGGAAQRPGRDVTPAAVRWLDRRVAGEPFFLWVHYFDPHAPYEAPAELVARVGSPYHAEVAWMDRAVGDLLARLRAEPDYDDMAIVVVGDHGESLGRHGEQGHALLIYDATIAVPMLVRLPGGERAGERSDATVSVVDVYPTLLSAMGLGVPAAVPGGLGELDGLDLTREIPPGRGVYFESYMGFLNFGYGPLAGWADAEGKYVHGPTPEYYGPEDAAQVDDLFREDDPRVARARRAIAAVAGADALPRGADEGAAAVDVSALAELGYAASASPATAVPHPLEPGDRPAPTDRLEEYAALIATPVLAAEGRREEAVAVLRAAVANDPRNAFARNELAGHLLQLGQAHAALEHLEALLEQGHERHLLHQRFVQAYEALGRYDEALDHCDRADALLPGDPTTARLRARVEAAAKRAAGD